MSDLGHKRAPLPSPLVLFTAIVVLAKPNFTVWTAVLSTAIVVLASQKFTVWTAVLPTAIVVLALPNCTEWTALVWLYSNGIAVQ